MMQLIQSIFIVGHLSVHFQMNVDSGHSGQTLTVIVSQQQQQPQHQQQHGQQQYRTEHC